MKPVVFVGPTLDVAAARITASDRVRTGYLRRHYGVRWDAPDLYDLVLNLAHLDVATAVDLVCLAAERMARTDTGSKQERLTPDAEGCA